MTGAFAPDHDPSQLAPEQILRAKSRKFHSALVNNRGPMTANKTRLSSQTDGAKIC